MLFSVVLHDRYNVFRPDAGVCLIIADSFVRYDAIPCF